MNMGERLKLLRKENNLSQEQFGEMLGVTRSVISNIELNRLAKPEQKNSLIKLISKEFNISEQWLLNGMGEMSIDESTLSLDDYAKKYNATENDLDFIRRYLNLDSSVRTFFNNLFKEKI